MKRIRKIKSIPISAIEVINPRDRRPAPFKQLVASIAAVGLKKPITVSVHERPGRYELVCGQGRIEAFAALKAKEIPAILVDATTEVLHPYEFGRKHCPPLPFSAGAC